MILKKKCLRKQQMFWHWRLCLHEPTSLPFQHYQGPSWKSLLSATLPSDAEVGKLKNDLELTAMGPWGRHILSMPRFHHLYDKDDNFCLIYHARLLGPSVATMFSETTLKP